MKMVRGALAFFVFVAIFVFAECKKEESEATSGTRTPASSSASGKGKVTPLPCLGTNMICRGDPCEIPLQVNDNDDHVGAQKTVYIYDSQRVKWVPDTLGDGSQEEDIPKIKELTFPNGNANKPNPAPHASATCVAAGTCEADGTSFKPCQKYNYVAKIHHQKKDKVADPELEVAGTTTRFGTNQPGTSTSGTSSTATQ